MRKMLMANPQVAIPPESGGLLERSVKLFLNNNYHSWEWLVDNVLGLWMDSTDFQYWNISEKLINDELHQLSGQDKNLGSIIDYIYLTYLRAHKPGAKIWGDKTPYATFGLKSISQLYPNGRIIHMLRDGRDVVNSMLKHARCNSVKEACSRWNDSLEILAKKHAKMKVLTIRYEQLVTQPEFVFKKVSQFLNTELKYVKNAPPVYLGDDHLAHHRDLQKSLHGGAIGSWQNEMSKDEIDQMLPLISANLESFGYV